MKKKDFDNRLQNDMFPDMPASFERGLKEALEQEGVRVRKRPTATGIFTAAVSVVAVAACLVIVLIGVLGGGKGKTNAAAPGEATSTPQMGQPTPTPMPMDQPTPIPMAQPTPMPLAAEWGTKVIPLNESFDFENKEKYEALYQGILSYLKNKGETEPEELWLCAMKPRRVGETATDGYYVLAQHSFDGKDGPELYCLSNDFEVLWATEGSGQGPNHAVHPEEDSYAARHQRHFLYGTEPMIAEPGSPHVKRGAVVGADPGTDIEFSMAASITEVQNRLADADSAYPGAAREYFLVIVADSSWDHIMQAHTLRFETEEGPVDVDMEKELSTVWTMRNIERPQPTPIAEVQGVEHWLAENQPLIRDFTDDWYGEEAVQQYAEAVRRALLVSGEHIQDELWICGVVGDGVSEKGTMPTSAYVLALNVGDGEPSPELFYYENGRILWMTQGADIETVNVVYHNGNTVVFGKSPAFDNRPLAMTSGRLTLENGDDELAPVLPLEQIQQRITGGPYYYSARECYLWKDGEKQEIKKLTIAAEVNGKSKVFALHTINVLTPQSIPNMAVKSGGMVYPGRVTLMAHSLNEDGVAADGMSPLEEIMANGILFQNTYIWQRPLTVLTASDAVSMYGVDVYLVNDGNSTIQATGQLDGADLSLTDLDDLPPGEYYLCFHTAALGPYSEKIGRYTFQRDFTIYKVTLK